MSQIREFMSWFSAYRIQSRGWGAYKMKSTTSINFDGPFAQISQPHPRLPSLMSFTTECVQECIITLVHVWWRLTSFASVSTWPLNYTALCQCYSPHVTSDTWPSRFSVCNIEKLGPVCETAYDAHGCVLPKHYTVSVQNEHYLINIHIHVHHTCGQNQPGSFFSPFLTQCHYFMESPDISPSLVQVSPLKLC